MKYFSHWILWLAAVCIQAATLNAIENGLGWPQFRGPGSLGIAESANPPIHFGPETNLLWKIEVSAGHSSPIVIAGRIIFNGAEGRNLLTYAVDQKTGSNLWQGAVSVDKVEKFHDVNTATPCTPVSDGQRAISYLPSFGVGSYDLDA